VPMMKTYLIIISLIVAASADTVLAQPAEPAAPTVSPDDLNKAADAAAEVAGVVPPPAAPSTVKPSSDDIDLGALGLDPATATAADDQLTVYGFADFSYIMDYFSNVSPIFKDSRTFAVGNLNLYLAKNLTNKARALAEIRFTFLPNASRNPDTTLVDTTATDVTNYSRPVQWGGIVIERAYVEYDITDHLTLRGGHWLTPYGIWNIDHGSPVILSPIRPYVVGQQFFPEHQTGLDLFGNQSLGGIKLGYHVTASNGRGGAEAQQDQDNKFAFGGRLELETPWGLKAGGSYYRGRYTGLPPALGAAGQTYLERAYGGDIQFDLGALHLQSEVIVRERHYEDGMRTTAPGGFAPDGRDLGGYALIGYRFHQLWNVMPFVYSEINKPSDHTLYERGIAEIAGLNFRPSPSLVLKAVAVHVDAKGTGLFMNGVFREIAFQVSWVF